MAALVPATDFQSVEMVGVSKTGVGVSKTGVGESKTGVGGSEIHNKKNVAETHIQESYVCFSYIFVVVDLGPTNTRFRLPYTCFRHTDHLHRLEIGRRR